MYLSCLLIDVGSNPDRPRPGRTWLHNLYRVHQRLCMAFPSAARRSDDREFLAPYRPEDFPEQRHLADRLEREGRRFTALKARLAEQPRHADQLACAVDKAVLKAVLKDVHSPRDGNRGFLFRIDPQPGGRVVIVVQSAVEPDWGYAFHNADHLLAAPWQVKPFDPCFVEGQRLQFRLVVNPTKRLDKNSRERDGRLVDQRWVGKRVPVPVDEFYAWLARRATPKGFSVDTDSTTVQPGYVYVNWERNGKGHRLRSARFDGVLTVTAPTQFQAALAEGIGSAKAFGFGLLSLARPAP